MSTLLLWLFASAAVPDVTAGPDLVDQAVVVPAPIARVTVFSDRARVRRQAALKLRAGAQTLRLPDLPGAVMLDSVRVECQGAKTIRVETVPVERERFSIDQVERLLGELEGLTDKLAMLDAERQVYDLELGVLAGIAPKVPVDEGKRVGRPSLPVLPEVWRKVLDFLQRQRGVAREKLRALDIKRRTLVEQVARAQREVGQYNLGAFTDHKVQVLVILEAEGAAEAKLGLEYFVPGAAWWPTYDLSFMPDAGKVVLRTAGLVQQATGEDWEDVGLELSTAIPSKGIEVPELLTWTLGEKREFIPQVRPARMPPTPTFFPPPVAGMTSGEALRAARQEVLRTRIGELQTLASLDTSVSVLESLGAGWFKGGSGQVALGSLGTGEGGRAYERPAAKPRPPSRSVSRPQKRAAPPPPPPMTSMPEAMPSEVMDDLREESVAAGENESIPVSRDTGRVRRTSLQLLDRSGVAPITFSDPSLPAVVAGGLDYVYRSPTPGSVPSSGERLRIPLASENFPVETLYEATPALKETAYLKAKVKNAGRQPILAGPVNIFVGEDFTGQGRLETTGPGGLLELPLGADEDIRFKRNVVPATETKGVFSKDDVTTYTVTIEVGNYKKKDVTVAVFDVLPRSGQEKVEIEKLKAGPVPAMGPDADGVIRWDLKIPAGQTRKIELTYKITRPKDWQLYQ